MYLMLLIINHLLGGKNLLPLLLSGGLGGGKKGGISPFLLTSLLGDDKCVEKHVDGCTQPTTANINGNKLCGHDNTGSGCEGPSGSGYKYACCPCCTCPDTMEAVGSGCVLKELKGLLSFTNKIDTAISSERELLAKDLADYKNSTGDGLEAFLMEKGGSPVRAMVVSTWRSGSTFLGIK